jgi:hypothetical protein
MRIEEVVDKKTIKSFHKVPFIIYKEDKNWIPNLKQDIEKKFQNKTNKIYDGKNAKRWIITDNSGKLAGRIAAFIHPKTVNIYKQPTGSIGFFECVNNQEFADKLFDSAKEWLKKQKIEAMDGPVNFGERDQFWGLLIKNFTSPPTYAMNYNPEYYINLFENYGFKTYFEQLMFHRDLKPAQDVFVKKAISARKDDEIFCENIRGKSVKTVAENFLRVYNDAWANTRKEFKEMTLDVALKVMKSLKPVYDPDIIIFAFKGKRPIGFYFNIPELNQIFKYVNGNLNFWGKIKFVFYKFLKKPTTMYGIVFGVASEFHGQGIEGLMIKFAEETILPLNRYKDTVLQWIGDFNPKMIRVCQNLDADLYRTYATYRYLFDRNKTFERAPIIE